MKPIDTRITQSMANNGNESIQIFIDQLKEGDVEAFDLLDAKRYNYISKEALYEIAYRSWCADNNETILPFTRFKEKMIHYDRSIEYIKIHNCKDNTTTTKSYFWGFKFPFAWVTPSEVLAEDCE